MKSLIFIFWIFPTLLMGLTSCDTDEPELPLQTEQPTQPNVPPAPEKPDNNEGNTNNPPMNHKLQLRIGTSLFTITLESNAAAKAFNELLPLTVNMADLNGNEKYFYLSANLPTLTSRPETIHTGDLMLYGSNCLVLFYDTFSSSYSYTRLGRVDNPSGLVSALGSGSSTVTFEITNNKQ